MSAAALVCANEGDVFAETSPTEREMLFSNLAHSHGHRLCHFIVRKVGNLDDAKDMTQQAFVEAMRSYGSYRKQSELSTWLYGIAMNLVRNHLSRGVHHRYEFLDDSELEHITCEGLAPDESMAQTQHMLHLQAALAELPQAMREVLFMVTVDELTYQDAAALLNVPVGTVRSRLSRGRVVLKEKLLARGVFPGH